MKQIKAIILLLGLTLCAYDSYAYVTNLTQLGIPNQAIDMALKAYQWAMKKSYVKNKRYLTLVDFALASDRKRLWVIDLAAKKIVLNAFVSHGKGSGDSKHATHFSNRPHSKASSLGVYLTQNAYHGKHGLSLRLNGVEPTNNHARSRAIVVHSAWYARQSFVKAHHYTGRSWGCFAISPSILKKVIHITRGQSVWYAYGATQQ